MKGSSFALLAFVAIAQTTVLANRASLLKADVNSQVQDLSGQGIAEASNAAPPPEVSGDGVRAMRCRLSKTQTQGSIKI